MSFKKLIVAGMLLLSVQLSPAQAEASWQEASDVVENTTREMLAVIDNETSYNFV